MRRKERGIINTGEFLLLAFGISLVLFVGGLFGGNIYVGIAGMVGVIVFGTLRNRWEKANKEES